MLIEIKFFYLINIFLIGTMDGEWVKFYELFLLFIVDFNLLFNLKAEDDDFTLRMFSNGLCIMRSYEGLEKKDKAPFMMLQHAASKENSERFKTLSDSLDNAVDDGLSSIQNEIKIKKIKSFPTFTHLLIDV